MSSALRGFSVHWVAFFSQQVGSSAFTEDVARRVTKPVARMSRIAPKMKKLLRCMVVVFVLDESRL